MAEPIPHVIFRLGRQAFAIRLSDIKDVARAPEITAVPQADPMVRGLTVLRNTLTTALDLRARFGLPAGTQQPATALAVDHEGERIALLVDKVEDVLSLGPTEPLAPSRDPLWQGVITGVVTRNDETIVVLDVAGIMDGALLEEPEI